MESLNPDCLREIITQLSLKDQIALLQVCAYLQQNVLSLWLTKYKYNQINFLERALSDQDLEIFFETIKDFAESFELRFLDESKYQLLKKFTYPQVQRVRLTIHPCFIKDEDLKDFHRMFPNLRVFSPHGHLTGKYLNLWPCLKELNLSYCYKLELVHFHNIMQTLHLEHLELNMFPISKQCEQLDLTEAHMDSLKYLSLNTYELYYFLSRPLPNLKELFITNQYNPRQLFDVILSVWKAKDICKLETNVKNVLANCLEMRMNVQELSIINDDNVLPHNVLKSLHQLDAMRILRFRDCDLTSVDLMELLKSIPQVDELSLENCRMSDQNQQVHVVEVGRERSKVLRLNFWQNVGRRLRNSPDGEQRNNNSPQPVDIVLRGQHELFEFTERRGPDLCFEPLYIKFH